MTKYIIIAAITYYIGIILYDLFLSKGKNLQVATDDKTFSFSNEDVDVTKIEIDKVEDMNLPNSFNSTDTTDEKPDIGFLRQRFEEEEDIVDLIEENQNETEDEVEDIINDNETTEPKEVNQNDEIQKQEDPEYLEFLKQKQWKDIMKEATTNIVSATAEDGLLFYKSLQSNH